MTKATILGALGLLVVVTALFAGPALSSPSSEQVTIKSLARQVNSLKRQVNSLNKRMARFDSCLQTAVPVSRYKDYVGTNSENLFVQMDPDEGGMVPFIPFRADTSFFFEGGLDVTSTGDPVDFYVSTVESSCVGSFRMAGVQAIRRR